MVIRYQIAASPKLWSSLLLSNSTNAEDLEYPKIIAPITRYYKQHNGKAKKAEQFNTKSKLNTNKSNSTLPII